MYAQRELVTVAGSATGYTAVVTGRIVSVQYVKTDYDANPDFSITTEMTGQEVWSEADVDASTTRAPRQATHDVTGTTSHYAAGAEPVEDYIVVANERIKIVTTGGGIDKTGTFYVTIA